MMVESLKSWPTSFSILRSAACPAEITSVNDATPTRLPNIMKPVRSL
jgi:hypothetical protein